MNFVDKAELWFYIKLIIKKIIAQLSKIRNKMEHDQTERFTKKQIICVVLGASVILFVVKNTSIYL